MLLPTGDDQDCASHLRHAGQQLEQPAARHGRRTRQEHLCPHGRERRRETDGRRIPQGMPTGRRTLQNALAWILIDDILPPHTHTHTTHATATVNINSTPPSALSPI